MITDDTGTQGRGNFQLEVNSEFGHSDGDGLKKDTISVTTVLSYGIVNQLDVILGLPYLQVRTEGPGTTTTERNKHQKGESPVSAYHVLPPAFN